MRRRDLSPSFFTSQQVLRCQPLARILFAGLWCAADREGRLIDDPWRIKLAILPTDAVDIDALLEELAGSVGPDGVPLIVRYVAAGLPCIAIPRFPVRQHVHPREVASTIPAPGVPQADPGEPRANLGEPRADPGEPRADLGEPRVLPSRALPSRPSRPSRSHGETRVRGDGSAEDDDPRLVAIAEYESALAARGLSGATAADRRIIGRRAGGLLEAGKDLGDVLAACRVAAQTAQLGLLDRYCGEAERDRLGVPRGERSAHQPQPAPRPPTPPVLAPADPATIEAGLSAFHAERDRLAAHRGNGNGVAEVRVLRGVDEGAVARALALARENGDGPDPSPEGAA